MSINRKPTVQDAQAKLRQRMSSHRLFRRMLKRQLINERTAFSGGAEAMLYRALDRCSHCTAKEACCAWLEGTGPAAGYVRFCPNSDTIEALRIAAR